MSLRRWVGFALSIAAAPSIAAAEPAAADDPLDGCDGLTRDRIARTERISDDALHAVTRSGERYVVFPHQEGRGCEVYQLGKPAAQASGAFDKAGQALALRPPRCARDSCGMALVVRKGDRLIAALRSDADCDESVALRAVKLFPRRDSLELVCHTSAGAGWHERRVLIDVTGDAIVPLYSLDTGSYIAMSPEEKRAGGCPSRPVGSIRIERTGERPVLRVVDPASGELHDGKGTLPARQLAYDPAQRQFVPTGAADVPTKVDAHAGCHRR